MRLGAWIMMLSVQIPVIVITISLFRRILGDKGQKEQKKEDL